MAEEVKMETFAARLGIPGLVFRPPRGEEDHSAIAEVINRSNEADGVDYVVTPERVAHWLTPRSDFDPRHDAVLAEMDGEAVGFGRVGWQREEDGAWIYGLYAAVVPAHRGTRIWDALLDYCESRLREIAAGHEPDGPCLFSSHADDRQRAWIDRLRGRGYRPVRYFYDMIHDRLHDLPPAPLPPGLEIRPVKPEHYRAVWEAIDEAFRDHWGYSEPTEEDYRQWLSRPYFAPDLWQVAWEEDQVAGVAINMIDLGENRKFNRRRGYVHTLGVRRPWRGRGLGRALLVRSLAMFRDRGMTEVCLGVDAENPTGALRLYESVGFRVLHSSAVWRKPMRKEENGGSTDP